MSSDSLPLDPRALIEHREFVRMLAKSLLGDEHAAQDVAQDTLLTLITHPPRSFESVRGWLAQVTRNRARNTARESERRTLREAAAARPEAHESEPSAQARLALQHRVVEAVLALREPYQSVIVLAYYEGSSAADIARQRNVPASTVRAQLSRALDLLRAKLDAETDGGRRAWSVGLAAFIVRSGAVAPATTLATSTKFLVASVLAVALVAPLAWHWVMSSPSGVSSPGELAQAVRPATQAVTSTELNATTAVTNAIADSPHDTAARAVAPVGASTLVVSGTVIDAQSQAGVPNVDVDASAGPLPGDQHARANTRSDAQGHYSLELDIPADLPRDPNVWAVQINARGDRFKSVFAQLRPAAFKSDPAGARTFTAAHDITIKLVLALRGRLVRESDRTGIPLGSVELVSTPDASTAPQSITTETADDTGRFLFRLESAVPGKLSVFGVASGFLAKMVPASFDATQTMDVGDIALAEGACLEGVVQTADGSSPVATQVAASSRARGVTWIYFHAGPWAFRNELPVPQYARAPIGSDGTFRLCGLAPGEYTLSVGYGGCRTGSRIDTLDVRAPATGVRLQVSAAVYRLRVFDAHTAEKLERAQFILGGPSGGSCPIERDMVVATDPGIETPGRLVAEGHRALNCTLPALAASEVREMEFRLEPLPPQVAPTIVVTSPTGAPVVDIEVDIRSDASEVEGQGPLPKHAGRAVDGRHVLPKLVPGAYHLDVKPRRQGDAAAEMWLGATLELSAREGMEPIKVQLVEGGLVSAVVKKTNGDPVDARTSLVRTAGDESMSLDWRNDAGTFVGWIPKQTIARLAKPLPVGRWKLRFESDGCKRKDVDVDVVGGRTTEIEVALAPEERR